MMSMRDYLQQLIALQTSGIQVVTLMDGTIALPQDEPVYTGKRFEQRGIRTVVQPDMDVMTMLSPDVLEMDGLWERHTAVVHEKLSIIYKTQRWIERSWLFGMPIPLVWLLYNYLHVGLLNMWSHIVESILITAVLYLSKKLIANTAISLLTRYIRKQLR